MKCVQNHYTRHCHIKEPICFKCGKPGHVTTECGQQKITFQPFYSQGKASDNWESLHHEWMIVVISQAN